MKNFVMSDLFAKPGKILLAMPNFGNVEFWRNLKKMTMTSVGFIYAFFGFSPVNISAVVSWWFYALSFYRSNRILCWSKSFVAAQKFDCIQGLFKNFCVGKKPILQNANHLFVGTRYLWLPQCVNRFLVWHKKFGPTQNDKAYIKMFNLKVTVTLMNLRSKSMLTWKTY